MTNQSKFHVEINNGPTFVLEVATTTPYYLAAQIALTRFKHVKSSDGADVAKIWIPDLVVGSDTCPGYGPYFYTYTGIAEESKHW